MAHAYWGDQDPVGQRLHFGGPEWRSIVGVVGDVRHEGLDVGAKPEMYLPFAQANGAETVPTIVVRTSIDGIAMTSTLRDALRATDPSIPMDQVRTMQDLIDRAAGQPRLRAMLIGALALLATIMALVGIYGVTSYGVTQRTRELGVRIAIGASTGDVLRSVLHHTLVVIVLGIAAGLIASAAVTRLLRSFLFGVAPLDPAVFAGVSAFLFVIAVVASYTPARRATRINPVVALRYE